jgi:nitrogen fixation protein FixH
MATTANTAANRQTEANRDFVGDTMVMVMIAFFVILAIPEFPF